MLQLVFQGCGSLRVDFSSKSSVKNAQYPDFLFVTRSPVPTFSLVFLLLLLYLRKPFLFFLTSLTSFSLTFLNPSVHSWARSLLGSLFPLLPSMCFPSTSAEVPCSFVLAFRHTSSNSCMLEWTDLGFEEVLCDKKNSRRGEGMGNQYFNFQFWPGNYKVSKYISVYKLGRKTALDGKFGNRRNEREWRLVTKGFNYSTHNSELAKNWDKMMNSVLRTYSSTILPSINRTCAEWLSNWQTVLCYFIILNIFSFRTFTFFFKSEDCEEKLITGHDTLLFDRTVSI